MENKFQEYITYLSPEFIYIPFDKMELLKIKSSKVVLNNTFLGNMEDGRNIFSPVSGKILGIKEMFFNDKKSNCLVVENDFIDKREKLNPSRSISKMKKSELKEALDKYGLNKKINSKTTLVVNSFYDKKTDLKDMVINYESYEEILEAIDEFMGIFNMKNCYICIDKSDLYSIHAYEKYINAFLNICIVHNTKKLKNENCVFYTIEEILAIHKAIHQDYVYDNTLITIYDGKESTVVKVKLYTSLEELLKVLKKTYKGQNVYVNNKKIEDIKDFVIDSTIRSVVIGEQK